MILDTHQLVCQEQDGRQAELPVVVIEEVLKRWTKVFQNQNIVVTLRPKPMHWWNANGASETLVHIVLVLDLRDLHAADLELDGNVVFRNYVDSAINNTCVAISKLDETGEWNPQTERTRPNSLFQPILATDPNDIQDTNIHLAQCFIWSHATRDTETLNTKMSN
jgi:hypothetical protein